MTLCASEPLMLTGVHEKSSVHIVHTVIYTHTQTCKHRDSDHIRTAMARSWTQVATSGVLQIRTSPANYQTIGVSTVIH